MHDAIFFTINTTNYKTKSLAVAKRPRDCCVDQLCPNVTGKRYFVDIIYLQPLWRSRPAKLSNWAKQRKIRAITPFRVIQDHRYRYQSKPVCDFLL